MIRFLLALWCLLLTSSAVLAQGNYLIRPGDTLRVEVVEDPSLNRDVLVLPDGRFSFPLAGTVRAGRRTVDQVGRSVAAAIAGNFAVEPNVLITVVGLAPPPEQREEKVETINIYILGEVESPGLREVPKGIQILQALSTSGGLTRFAATKRLQLRRSDPHGGRDNVYVVNYRALSRGAALSNNIVLRDGDVILVPERRLFE